MQNPQAVLDVLNYYEHSSKKTEDKYMTQTPSTDPSPRPSYSVSSHALSSPSSQSSQPVSGKNVQKKCQNDVFQYNAFPGVSPSPPVSCASVPSPVLPEPPLGPTSTTQGPTRLTSSSSNTPSVFSTTPDQVAIFFEIIVFEQDLCRKTQRRMQNRRHPRSPQDRRERSQFTRNRSILTKRPRRVLNCPPPSTRTTSTTRAAKSPTTTTPPPRRRRSPPSQEHPGRRRRR